MLTRAIGMYAFPSLVPNLSLLPKLWFERLTVAMPTAATPYVSVSLPLPRLALILVSLTCIVASDVS